LIEKERFSMNAAEQFSTIVNAVDLIDIANELGLKLYEEYRALCPKGHAQNLLTLQFDEETQSFLCSDPDCRFHGGAVDLVEQVTGMPLGEVLNMLASAVGMGQINADEYPDFELLSHVRACLQAAALFYARNLNIAMPHLERRGISGSTAERFFVGSTTGKDDLKQALIVEGFDETIIREAGLLNQHGDDFFQNRVMVPIRMNGQATGFYGLALNDEDEVRHLFLGNDRFIIADIPFNWNPRREEAILVEGIFDALSLIEAGFANAVATFGTQGLASRDTEELLLDSSLRRVWVCYDGDQAGQKAVVRDSYMMEDLGLDVKIVDLNQDPNEFMLAHGAEEFQGRLAGAVAPVQWEIERVDPESTPEEKIAALENVFHRCKTMKPLHLAACIERIAELGFSKREIREHIKSLPDNDGDDDPVDLTNRQIIHPALDVVGDTLLMTVPQAHLNRQTGEVEWVPYVVTSQKELFRPSPGELDKRGYFTRVAPSADAPRYSPKTIKGLVAGTIEGDLIKTFWTIYRLLKQNLDFQDENTYLFLTAWIIGTYFHPMFNYFPYLHFTGTKNVGKSKAMKLMSCICFNGIMSVSVTPASQFRIIEAFRPTLFMDETEDLKERGFSDKRALLLGGYEAGSSVLRTEKAGETLKVRRLGNYGPRAFASIEGLEDTLASRTIQITMHRSYDDKIKEREVNLNDPLFQEIRDDLFLVAMRYPGKILRIYAPATKPDGVEFGDREFNLFKPILAIGIATGDDLVVEGLIEFANTSYRNKVAEYNTSAPENVLLQYLLEQVTKDDWYRSDDLHRDFIEFIRTNGIELNIAITKAMMGTLMRKLGVLHDTRRSTDRTCTLYQIKREVVERVAENYQVR
jgi:DNA primase catalytic core